MTALEVADAADLDPGDRAIVSVNGREIGVFNVDGDYYALPNRCPHQGGPLCEGPVSDVLTAEDGGDLTWDLEGEVVYCPWHQLSYHIPTGESRGFSQSLPTYRVYVEDGTVFLDL